MTKEEVAAMTNPIAKLLKGLAGPASQAESQAKAMVDALNKSLAVIEFDLTGNILHANDNFLGAMGYTLEEIKGKHHSMFVTPEYAHSAEYRSFWDNLGRGQYQSSEFPRVAKGGREIWIQASYNPIFNSDGKPFKVVKFAADITEQKLKSVNAAGQLEAINRAQAVIEFNMDGTIIHANDNFLSTVGYSLDEIRGKHHSMFVESGYGQSNEYRLFWDALNRGEFKTAEFRRFGKNGKEIWIQASYNPILDPSGKPIKVVKFATDITEQKQITADITGQISAIRKSQAVIEFELDGTIRHANENFLATVATPWRKYRASTTQCLSIQRPETATTTNNSGKSLLPVSFSPVSFAVSGKPARKFGFRPLTTPFLMHRTSQSKW